MRAARAMDCRCLLTKNLFAHSVSRHFDYDGPAAFAREQAAYLCELGHARAAVLIDELEVEARRRANLDADARKRTAEIRARYPRMHPALFKLDAQRWLDPRFVKLAELARARPDAFRSGLHAAGGAARWRSGRGRGELACENVALLHDAKLPYFSQPPSCTLVPQAAQRACSSSSCHSWFCIVRRA
jgi:hypothetical protein